MATSGTAVASQIYELDDETHRRIMLFVGPNAQAFFKQGKLRQGPTVKLFFICLFAGSTWLLYRKAYGFGLMFFVFSACFGIFGAVNAAMLAPFLYSEFVKQRVRTLEANGGPAPLVDRLIQLEGGTSRRALGLGLFLDFSLYALVLLRVFEKNAGTL